MLKREMRAKRVGSAKKAFKLSPSLSPDSASSPARRPAATQDFGPWYRQGDLRIGPDMADPSQSARAFYVLPRGRVYCNINFSILRSNDKVTYTWITPSGRKFYQKTLVKVLAQRQTWSWNYIDLSEERAQSQAGQWAVKVTLNGKRIWQAFFNVLSDWIDVRRGALPIILLCPHGGRVAPARCSDRSPEMGEALGCTETADVIRNISNHLEYMFQVAPTVIYCNVNRRWLDVDVPEHEAYADSKMAPYYHAYYEAVLASIQHTMKLQRRIPLMLSLRSHHEFHQQIYASTLNGQTLQGMHERGECGDPRFTNEGLNARLAATRHVIPANQQQRDDSTYGAGNLTRTFGRDHSWHTDAFDVVCPKSMVSGEPRRPSLLTAHCIACSRCGLLLASRYLAHGLRALSMWRVCSQSCACG